MTQAKGGSDCPYSGLAGTVALKGSLHNHTVASDGPITHPREVRRVYEEAGYHFAAITDHDRRMGEVPWADADYEVCEPGVFALWRGYEASLPNDHVNCLGCLPHDLATSPKEPGFVAEAKATGAFTWLNHPAKYNDCPERVLGDAELRQVHGLEVYSGARVAKDAGPLAETLWDACLRRGRRYWALASPDCHRYDPSLPDSPFNGYIVAFARAIEPAAIMEALLAGRFYASTGVEVRSVRCVDGTLHVQSTNADRVRFIGAAGVLAQANGPAAAYRINGDEGYVRAELERDEPCFPTSGAPRQKAWLQPLWT